MSQQWHYSSGGQPGGPVSSAELKALAAKGMLKPGDLVWKEGMGAWKPASAIKGLFTPKTIASPQLDCPPSGPTPDERRQRIGANDQASDPEISDVATEGRSRRVIRRSLFALAAAAATCFVGLVIHATYIAYERPGEATATAPTAAAKRGQIPADWMARGAGYLDTFDQHPPPILECASAGKRVLLLDDFHSDTIEYGRQFGQEHREALYAVYGSNGDLESVVLKVQYQRDEARLQFNAEAEVVAWNRWPRGESGGETVNAPFRNQRLWEGKIESAESARVRYWRITGSSKNPDDVWKLKTTLNASARWNRGGAKVGWESFVESEGTVKKFGSEHPHRNEKTFKGTGEILRSTP